MTILLVIFIILFILSITVNVLLGILVKKSIFKISGYEKEIIKSDNFIISVRENILKSLSTMREIDKQGVFSSRMSEKGLFESDDMVGTIFQELMMTVEELNNNINELNEKK